MKILLTVAALIALAVMVGAWRAEIVSFGNGVADVASGRTADRLEERIDELVPRIPKQAGKNAWLTSVNASCARRNAMIAAVRAPRGGLKDLRRYAGQVLAVQRTHARDRRAIATPPGVAREMQFMALADKQTEVALKRVIAATSKPDAKSAERAVALFESTSRMTSGVFRTLGLSACASLA
jgi:hypothetical protein